MITLTWRRWNSATKGSFCCFSHRVHTDGVELKAKWWKRLTTSPTRLYQGREHLSDTKHVQRKILKLWLCIILHYVAICHRNTIVTYHMWLIFYQKKDLRSIRNDLRKYINQIDSYHNRNTNIWRSTKIQRPGTAGLWQVSRLASAAAWRVPRGNRALCLWSAGDEVGFGWVYCCGAFEVLWRFCFFLMYLWCVFLFFNISLFVVFLWWCLVVCLCFLFRVCSNYCLVL